MPDGRMAGNPLSGQSAGLSPGLVKRVRDLGYLFRVVRAGRLRTLLNETTNETTTCQPATVRDGWRVD